MIKYYIAIFLIFSNAFAISLEDAIVSAYRTNPALKSLISDLQANMEVYPKALGDFLPVLQLQNIQTYAGYSTPEKSIRSTPLYDYTPYNNWQLSLQLNLFKSLGSVYNMKSARNTISSLTFNFYASEQNLIYSVISAYLEVLVAQKTYEATLSAEQANLKNAQIVAAELNVGNASTTDYLQAQAAYTSASADLYLAETDLNTAKNNFVNITGLPAENLDTIKLDEIQVPDNWNDVQNKVINNNPLIMASYYYYMAMEDAMWNVKSNLLPKVDMSVGYQNGTNPQQTLDNNTTIEGASIVFTTTIPLYDAGIVRSNIRQQKNNTDASYFTYQDTLKNIKSQSYTTYHNLKSAKLFYQSSVIGLKAANASLLSVQSEYMNGTKQIIDLLNAQQDQFQAEIKLIQAEQRYVLTAFSVKQYMGVLNPQGLNLNIAPYDPELYFDDIKTKIFSTSVKQQ